MDGKMSILMRPFDSCSTLRARREEVMQLERHLRALRVTLAQQRRRGEGATGESEKAAAAGSHPDLPDRSLWTINPLSGARTQGGSSREPAVGTSGPGSELPADRPVDRVGTAAAD